MKERVHSDVPMRVVRDDGNGTFVYDVSGTRNAGASYAGIGPMLNTDHGMKGVVSILGADKIYGTDKVRWIP